MDLSLLGGMDPTSIGADAGMVAAVNEMTNWVKARLDEWTWDDKFSRFYPAVPFLCAFAVCYLLAGMPTDMAGLTIAGKNSLTYGLWATLAWNVSRVSVKGE